MHVHARVSECDANYHYRHRARTSERRGTGLFSLFPILLYSNQICKSSRVTHITKVCATQHSFGLILYSQADIVIKNSVHCIHWCAKCLPPAESNFSCKLFIICRYYQLFVSFYFAKLLWLEIEAAVFWGGTLLHGCCRNT